MRVFFILAMVGLAIAPARQKSVAPPPAVRVVVLGSGNPNPDPERAGPAVAVVVDGAAYLLDCGSGMVRRAVEASRSDGSALLPENFGHVFITHLHSDHTLGYPELLVGVENRTRPLDVYGPAGLKAMTDDLLRAFQKDIAIRTTGLEHANPVRFQANVHEIAPGVVYRDAHVTVTAFLVRHGAWGQAFGYRFQAGGRVIVFSGDTAPADAVVQACDGCDLLFHEVYNPRGLKTDAWRAYFAAYHTSPGELGKIAAAAHPRLLVLYHQVFEGLPESDLLTQVRQAYAGQVVSAHDLQVF